MTKNQEAPMTPREYLKQLSNVDINEDNESDDCDHSWTMVEDWMEAYANHCASYAYTQGRFDAEEKIRRASGIHG